MRLYAANTQRQRGQAMTEYLIILPTLLLLVLGVIQFALIYQAKASLNYATFMGARQGALKNANKTSIMDGVAGGMTPFFTRASTAPALNDMAKARMIAAIEIFNPNTAKVEIISPTLEAFKEFTAESETDNIPNDNLMYRKSGDLKDGMSIQDANLVKNMTQDSYWSSNAETIPNMCSTMNNAFASSRQQVNALTSKMPAEIALPANGLANSMMNLLPQQFPTIPVLNWNVGGMRIPITAEAIVRMQSSVKF